ncbi:hypothetical protein BC628DRAFT_648245 [Trametes gibbosa]|nr:hypothetical protein BC628DRAFT_648245 [Trametes gibbosa]
MIITATFRVPSQNRHTTTPARSDEHGPLFVRRCGELPLARRSYNDPTSTVILADDTRDIFADAIFGTQSRRCSAWGYHAFSELPPLGFPLPAPFMSSEDPAILIRTNGLRCVLVLVPTWKVVAAKREHAAPPPHLLLLSPCARICRRRRQPKSYDASACESAPAAEHYRYLIPPHWDALGARGVLAN